MSIADRGLVSILACLCLVCVATPSALAIQNTPNSNADDLAIALFPGGDGLVYTSGAAFLDFGFESGFSEDGPLPGDGFPVVTEIEGEEFEVGEPFPAGPFDSIGTFVNPAGTYGIGGGSNTLAQGIVISSGSVSSYNTGPNVSGSTSTDFFAIASPEQEALLSSVTGQPVHFDATLLTIPFNNTTGVAQTLDLFAVFGTEETPDFVGTNFNDGFGVFLNGENIALSGGLPLNVDHPGQLPFFGTELDSVVAVATQFAGFDPRVDLSIEVAPGQHILEIILGDASDGAFDSTAFISRNVIPGPSPGAPLLPSNTPQPGEPFVFDEIDAGAGEPVFIDPEIAIGYVYDASQPVGDDPLFASVTANPAGSDTVFTVNFDGQSETLLAGQEFTFPSPVDTFTITDIDPSEALPADDPLAFLTVVTFASAVSNAQVTQLPISVSIPEPNAVVLVLAAACPCLGRRR